MPVRKIKVVLNTDSSSTDCGKFSVDLNGYEGKGCDVDIAMFQNLGSTTKAMKKPEYKSITQSRVSVNA